MNSAASVAVRAPRTIAGRVKHFPWDMAHPGASGAATVAGVSDRWATFDCYGTLIDWEGGLRSVFRSLWPQIDADRLASLHHTIEPRVEERGELGYREVLARCLAAVAAIEDLEVPEGRRDALRDSLPSWPPFPEVPGALRELRARRWRLAILSNTDPELLASSIDALGVPIDVSITAADAGSYKPAPGHWERFFAGTGAHRGRHVHVAASLFHDIEPAHRLGLTAVWINRLGESSDIPRAAELPDLTDLPDILESFLSMPGSLISAGLLKRALRGRRR
jgi:2-haloacid dehalogenase